MEVMEVNKREYMRLRRLIRFWAVLTLLLCAMMLFQSFLLHQMVHGDINHDGKVDALDLSVVAAHWSDKAKHTSYHASSGPVATFTLPVQQQPVVQDTAPINNFQDTATVNQLQ